MNSKHLATGAEFPPLQDGKLRIYSMRHCPFAQRVLLVAEAKGIPHDIINCNLQQKPEWLLERNPGGTVPTIDTPKGPLHESLIIAEYLDETFPGRKLTSGDPYQKARDKIWMENASKIYGPFYKMLSNPNDPEEDTKDRLKQLADAVAPYEIELNRRGTPFFGGSEPGMLDYAIWPWFQRIGVLKILFPKVYDFDSAKAQNPNLEKWRQAMKEDKAVKASYVSPEICYKFSAGYVAGNPNYEILSAEN